MPPASALPSRLGSGGALGRKGSAMRMPVTLKAEEDADFSVTSARAETEAAAAPLGIAAALDADPAASRFEEAKARRTASTNSVTRMRRALEGDSSVLGAESNDKAAEEKRIADASVAAATARCCDEA